MKKIFKILFVIGGLLLIALFVKGVLSLFLGGVFAVVTWLYFKTRNEE